ncbi:protein containing Transcriptional regulator IclR [mine drainage metagenome]|uniref:Protein containing Transcriptional regulator IclR n=1 Tax=mine drainage metagenome TaxID=410659 RepID=T0YJL2_9ZZZZ
MQHGSPSGSPTQTVHRVVRILKAFDGHHTLGITELAARTNVPRSSVHRIVRALVDEQLLTQDADSRRYELSLGLAEFGTGILRSNTVRTASRPTVLDDPRPDPRVGAPWECSITSTW